MIDGFNTICPHITSCTVGGTVMALAPSMTLGKLKYCMLLGLKWVGVGWEWVVMCWSKHWSTAKGAKNAIGRVFQHKWRGQPSKDS